MPFEFEAQGWEDESGNRHRGKPSDTSDTFGMFVHAYDPKSGEDHHFWAFVYQPFDSWEDWLVYVGALMQMHGMDLA